MKKLLALILAVLTLTAALCVFAVRMLATKYKWNFPTAQK